MQAVPSVPPFPTVHAPPLISLSAGIRWATLALALVIAAGSGATTVEVGAWAVALAALAFWQADGGDPARRRARIPGVVELAVYVAAVAATGEWTSPFVVCVLGGVMSL